ncbi:Phage capsid family protein [Posidoniimonas corsicana]|uniref:Phage capsid family protein n=1 Tax=Posidoniimonas corsicana TaxID=1938618 RepID=A0A5C5VFR5_9BACT|nr:phage major capsid protein [Posidoniimonas corsicana]TWT37484.1 Phage capsid family protein [Posidoniimonas corsicana]
MVDFTKKNARDLEAERLALIDEADGIARLREGKNARDLNDQEQARFDELTSDGGLIDQKAEEVDVQHRIEKNRDAQRAAKLGAYSGKVGGPYTGDQRRHRVVEPNNGGIDPQLARLAGGYFTAIAAAAVGDYDKADAARGSLVQWGASEFATMTEGTPSAGGYIVPTPIASEIERRRDEVGVTSKVARTFSMTSESLTIPAESGRPTTYIVGEGNSITASDAALQTHMLTVKKRASFLRSSPEFLADAAGDAGAWIVDAMAYSAAEQMDSELVNGDGTSTYGGITGLVGGIGSAAVKDADSGETSLGLLDVEDWTGTIALMPPKYLDDAAWVMPRATWNNSCLPLMANSGGAGFASLMAGAPGTAVNWFGYPVHFTEQMPTAAVSTFVAFLVSKRHGVYLGDRGDMRVAVTDLEQFQNDLVSFKVTHRYDLLLPEPGNADDAGSYVGLKLAAS